MARTRHIESAERAEYDKIAAEWVDTERLRAWDKNPRKNDHVVQRVAASLIRFGWGSVILARTDGTLVAGHTRMKAHAYMRTLTPDSKWHIDAKRAVETNQVPVRYGTWSANEAAQLALADNRLGELAEWDNEQLVEILGEMEAPDIELIGWDSNAYSDLLDSVREDTSEDYVPPTPKNPVSKDGDVWLLGDHRLACGDSTTVPLLDEACKQVWTDPPYGLNITAGGRDLRSKTHERGAAMKNDALPHAELFEMITHAIKRIPILPGATMYMASGNSDILMRAMTAYNNTQFVFKHSFVWVKDAFVFSRLDYHYQHENILYGWADGAHLWNGDRKQTSVFEYASVKSQGKDGQLQHPTSKPVGMIVEMIQNNTRRGDLVADPFGGSGSTLIACETIGRRCTMSELSPAYCDVIVDRWQTLTGGTAKRVSA